jgi:hypothetical protein
VPNGRGCGQYVSTSTPLHSLWMVVPDGQKLDGQNYLATMGFCSPALDFSKLNGDSKPVGIWMLSSLGELTVNHSNSTYIYHGQPYGKPWAVGANVSATISSSGDNQTSFVQFAVDGVVQGPAVGIVVPAVGLVGCAAACANGTALALAT